MFVQKFISYDRAKSEKIGKFFAITWLIFAVLVTYIVILSDNTVNMERYAG